MALASSFRAVLGVAEHFSRLRVQIGSIITGFAIFQKFRKYIYNMMVYIGILRGEKITDIEERAWQKSIKAEALANENTLTPEIISASTKSTWPIVAFLAVALGTPYVVYNVLKNVAKDHLKMESNKWIKGEGDHFVAIANFDFVGEGGHHNGDRYFKELSFKKGDKLFIAPKELQRAAKGWLLASLNNKIGLVPYNYLSQPIRVNNQIEILKDDLQITRPISNENEA
jgi:peroxin-13